VPSSPPPSDLDRLRRLVQTLRAPDGCPWDREQTLSDLRAYLIEEAHEAAAALDEAVLEDEWGGLAEELGDLLFQLVFVAVLAEERQQFDIGEVIDGVEHKMIERHPHVFGEEDRLEDAGEVRRRWEERKRRQRRGSILDGLPSSLPGLTAALRMTQKAAAVGFDWASAKQVLEKLDEEVEELRHAATSESDRDRVEEELGDILFTVANLGRHLEVDPEAALARANLKFRRRFAWVEEQSEEGDTDLEQLEELWQQAKSRGL
jgi:tetrapyrrole methylase family protein/MazG family protein